MDSTSKSQINELNKFIKSRQDSRELKRAIAVKLALKKYPYLEIQSILNVSPSFITKWKKAFFAEGIKGLSLKYKGAKPLLNNSERPEILEWLKEKDAWDFPALSSYVFENYKIRFKSKQSYYNLFKQAGISWKKSQKKNPKKDPKQVEEVKKEITQKISEFQEKIQENNLSVFLVDECHLLWGDVCGYVWGKTSERVEIPISNEREKQTYYGALNYQTKQFLTVAYKTADSEQTVDFVKYLLKQCPGQRIVLIWDRASYHRYKHMKKYLQQINQGLSPESWAVTCILLAPNATEQNPVEDIWLQGKNEIRNKYHLCHSFKQVKELFVNAIDGQYFTFPKADQ